MKAYKLRLYPNKEQEQNLEFTLEMCRQTYNSMLGELNKQVVIDRAMIQAMLPDMKICEPKFKQVYSKTLQYECYRLFSNLSALKVLKQNKKKVGRLRFKGKGWFKTINYNQSGFKLDKENNRLRLSKIGNIKIKIHREVEGNIKQITIKKSIDKWYATIITDAVVKTKCGDEVIGIDLGINNYLVDNNNHKIENPKTLNKYLKELRVKQKNLSRKKKGSNNRKKARKQVAKLYDRITNTRRDFLHKLTTKLVRSCRIIVREDLDIKQMSQQKYFNACNMLDCSWGEFSNLLNYKAENAGCLVIKVNPKNTTKMCSQCGNLQEMFLYKRTYECANCGFVIDRDYNSAKNILKLGQELSYVENNPSVQLEQGLSMKQEALTSKLRF
ncbi:MAG: transposase [Nanoarchaeota archaeon]|nr:transposase [Nanoarchaeota archaeon]